MQEGSGRVYHAGVHKKPLRDKAHATHSKAL
jgi:hypothetical protein